LVRGEGCWVFDADGKRYLDFIGGIATVSVGHANPRVREALMEQAKLLWHASNLYVTEPQIRLAEKLTAQTKTLKRAFFCNSGTEANEAMIKLARHFHVVNGHPERIEILCFHNSFHGRTLGSLAATGQHKYQQGFGPLPEGFRFLEYGNVAELEAAISEKTCAVMLEAIQGEAGVLPPPRGYLGKVRELCTKHGALMILDEVQTGMGRTGARLSRRLGAIGGRTSGERGAGLLRALLLGEDLAPKVVAKARELGLLVNAVGDRVVRLAPPLTVSDEEIDRASELLAEAVVKA